MPAKKNPDATPALTNPIFTDASAAREHLEALRWPDGPVCAHCGVVGESTRLESGKHRPGTIQCNACRKQYSVTVGTLFESSHLPLNKWMLAFHLMASSKKGMSAHQMHRMLDITYKTAWFMCHRIREAMTPTAKPKLGGGGKTIEVDETFWGTKPGGVKKRSWHHKNAVMALVERGGKVRSLHVPTVNAKTVRTVLDQNAHKDSHLMTDDSRFYMKPGTEFTSHTALNHTRKEYGRGEKHSNTVECYFSLLKRGLVGTFHHVSAEHLHRYCAEFDFRWNHRIKLDPDGIVLKISDVERATSMLQGIEGKRLTYRRLAI
jgi:transposase-like protein